MEEHKEYKVKLTAQEIFDLKDHHRELMEDTFSVSYTHLRAHETREDLVCRRLL